MGHKVFVDVVNMLVKEIYSMESAYCRAAAPVTGPLEMEDMTIP